jgi:hypothetical protein
LRDPSHNWAYPAVRLQAYFEDAKLKVEQFETLKLFFTLTETIITGRKP